MSNTKGYVLFVDTNTNRNSFLIDTLQRLGYALTATNTLADAHDLARANSFDLIILDVRLPGGTGFDLCEDLRQMQPDTPVLYYSDRQPQHWQLSRMKPCADQYLAKPVSALDLEVVIRKLIESKRA